MKSEQAYLELADAIKERGNPVCREIDPDLWFPEVGGENFQFRAAKKFCAKCPVKSECLNLALVNQEPFGIWGGLTTRERAKLLRR